MMAVGGCASRTLESKVDDEMVKDGMEGNEEDCSRIGLSVGLALAADDDDTST